MTPSARFWDGLVRAARHNQRLAPSRSVRLLSATRSPEKETTDRRTTWIRLVGRRSSTLTRAQADGFIVNFGRRLAADFPAVNAGATWRILPINVAVAPDNGPGILGMLLGLSGFVRLIACSSLANLLLARPMAHARDPALPSPLGPPRPHP